MHVLWLASRKKQPYLGRTEMRLWSKDKECSLPSLWKEAGWRLFNLFSDNTKALKLTRLLRTAPSRLWISLWARVSTWRLSRPWNRLLPMLVILLWLRSSATSLFKVENGDRSLDDRDWMGNGPAMEFLDKLRTTRLDNPSNAGGRLWKLLFCR